MGPEFDLPSAVEFISSGANQILHLFLKFYRLR